MNPFRVVFSLLVACAASVGVLRAAAPVSAKIDFNRQIRPLLSDRCYHCHGPDAGTREAKLRLDTREGALKPLDDGWAVIKPGDAAKSELVRRIFSDDADERMPPADSKLSLNAEEKALLKRWIEEGAEYQLHWAFVPIGAPAVPTAPTPVLRQWIRSPIDAFVAAKLHTEKLLPSAEAPRETLLRRITFNLTGLPPKPADIDAFLADKSPDAYERAVDRALASPAYGERMAQDWLDLARYADTYGYQADVERDMSPWRDWVIRAFNQNLSYDRFLTWQLAGDLLPNATPEQRLATAFNRLHRQTNEGGSIEGEFRAEYASDRVDTFGTAMLGLTLGCARCHDHKFDPISQRDYYSLFAFFNNIDESGLYSHFTKATPTPTLLLWPEEKAQRRDELEKHIAEAAVAVERRASEARPAYEAWLKAGGKVEAPVPRVAFSFDAAEKNIVRAVEGAGEFALEDGPEFVPGKRDQALQFSGDNRAVAKGIAPFKRTDAFSFSLWLKPTEAQERAVVLHQSRAWSDSGSRGYELVLDRGRPFFALIHFWPGNAVAVRAKQALPLNAWSQLAITYDGSSRASGVALYLNGAPVEAEIVRDQLTKDIVHRTEWGDAEVGKINLTLAGRFRDSGFKHGSIDELQIFDRALTAPEVALLSRPAAESASEPTLTYYLSRHDESYQNAQAVRKGLWEDENALRNDVPEIMVMEEMSVRRPTHLLKRGAYDSPGELVQPDTPSSVLQFSANLKRDRLGLAQWLIDPQHPLAARVAVNRVWRLHFGRGLVATPEDFGSQGRPSSHPELLDWLAREFIASGWDLKALHRRILISATFRQTSVASHAQFDRDPANVLLSRGPKQRLPAEHIRDSALAASGLLVATIGGPSVKPYQPAGLWEQSGTGKTYKQDTGEKLYRRSLYTFWRRTSPPPSMLMFDALTREVCSAKRESTSTPLQSLVLLNDPQFIEAARVLATRLIREQSGVPAAQIAAAFRTLTGRVADATELRILERLYHEQHALYATDSAAAEKLLSVGEYASDKTLSAAEVAALAMTVNAIMNFDEFVTLR